MNDAYLITLGQRTIMVVLQLTAPLLGLSLIVGLAVSIFQAVTQLHDMTLTFVPKIISVVVAIVVFGPWMLRTAISFTQNLFISLPSLVR
jgi:flagellar biosynthetic protein FliQ